MELDERTEGDQRRGLRCGIGRYDHKTAEHVDECEARAAWRVDMICDLCAPRVGECCELHNQLP